MSQATLLDGIVVLDATQVMAGPYCAMLLADMGARVIKVEPPAGDSTRVMAGARGNDSAAFNAVNRGKLGTVIDLNTERGRNVFKRLARSADILVENYRPGVMQRLGLDYAALSAENPRLIYASISGHGQTGPWGSKGGFDLIAQGLSGLMSVTGHPGAPPAKVGVPITDLGAALFALAGVLAALHHRSETGLGQQVDTSLLEAGLALSAWEVAVYSTTGQVPAPLGSAHRLSAPYQAFRCSDGYITIGGANDRNFVKIAVVLGRTPCAYKTAINWPAWLKRSPSQRAARTGSASSTPPECRAAPS
jgi:formyl-CoA transferase